MIYLQLSLIKDESDTSNGSTWLNRIARNHKRSATETKANKTFISVAKSLETRESFSPDNDIMTP